MAGHFKVNDLHWEIYNTKHFAFFSAPNAYIAFPVGPLAAVLCPCCSVCILCGPSLSPEADVPYPCRPASLLKSPTRLTRCLEWLPIALCVLTSIEVLGIFNRCFLSCQEVAFIYMLTSRMPNHTAGAWTVAFLPILMFSYFLLSVFFFPVLAARYLRVQIYPLTPTKTSTSNRSPFHLPGTASLPRGSRSSSPRSSRSPRSPRSSRRSARSWAALLSTASAAPAAPTMAATARTLAATSTLPWCWEGRRIQKIERVRQ